MSDKKKEIGFETVKLHKEFVSKVREHKKKTGVPLSVFIEQAGMKELAHIELKENEKI